MKLANNPGIFSPMELAMTAIQCMVTKITGKYSFISDLFIIMTTAYLSRQLYMFAIHVFEVS
jgi:hypothetical protein